MTNPGRPSTRPDLIDMIGPEFDRQASEPAGKTLIICAAPRTGSYELCRYLAAAGIGVPHEYFNSTYANRLAKRWAFRGDPLSESELGRYIDMLRHQRSSNGVFVAKLQYPHFEGALRNGHGAALFHEACVVHLFRPDAAAQFASFRAARESGRWDFSSRQTTPPLVRKPSAEAYLRQAVDELDAFLCEDSNFRRLFVLLGIRPLFLTTDRLFAEPRSVVDDIAAALSVTADAKGLEQAVSVSVPYDHDRPRQKATAGLADRFKDLVFPRQS
jgi:LPS sulfotransferase NodH